MLALGLSPFLVVGIFPRIQRLLMIVFFCFPYLVLISFSLHHVFLTFPLL
jgi:hypothetical protein